MGAALRALSWPYRLAIAIYNWTYEAKVFSQVRLPVPVISVGNITVGGTGKTPLVEYLAGWLSSEGLKVVILSRGYKAPRGMESDEATLLRQNLPSVPHLIGANRYVSGLEALRRFGADLFILDDGFQYRRLFRDLDIVTINGMQPLGSERLLPAGPLREPPSALGRAHLAVISYADFCPEEELEAIESRLRSINENLVIARTSHRALSLDLVSGEESYLPGWLKNRRVLGFCGIGSPGGFRRLLKKLGAELVDFRIFPDHYYYSQHDLNQLVRLAKTVDADALVTTQKDAVRLAPETSFQLPVVGLRIACKFLAGELELQARIKQVIGKKLWQESGSSWRSRPGKEE